MTFKEFLEELRQKKVEITFSGGKLKYSGPEENITPELVDKLKEFKGRLIKHFWPKELGNLMPINPDGNKVPLFIVHGDNSNYIISEYFGDDQPVYGFFHPGSDGEGIPFKSVEVMARTYLKRIIAVYPSGPYYLIGYSFGGVLAFEIAIQLQKSGKKVPFLALIDAISPVVYRSVKLQEGLFRRIRINILRPLRRKLKRDLKLLICNIYILRKKPIPAERRSYYLWTKYLNMTKKYRPLKFDGNILLFRTSENSFTHKLLGWENLAKDIKLIEIEGKHLEIFVGRDRTNILSTEIEKQLDIINRMN
jgi:thioesterase domain-containing protein